MTPVFATDKINVELLPPSHVVLDLSLGKVPFIDLPDCWGKFGCIFKNQSVASPQIVAILGDRPQILGSVHRLKFFLRLKLFLRVILVIRRKLSLGS